MFEIVKLLFEIVGWVESFVPPAYTAQLAPVPRVPVMVNITVPGGQTLVIFAARVGVVEDWFIVIATLLLFGGLPALSHDPFSVFTE